MPLMLVEADVLHRVLRTLEENISVENLRQRQRTPILGLRAMVNDARNSEREYEERERTAQVIGCLECNVLNDVSHCRECGSDLTIEPVRCVEGDLAPAAERLTREREERRAAEQRREEERRRQQRVRAAANWMDAYQRFAAPSASGGRTVPLLCEQAREALHQCDTCWGVVRNFVQREQDVADGFGRRADSRGVPTDPHAEVNVEAESVVPTVRRPTRRPVYTPLNLQTAYTSVRTPSGTFTFDLAEEGVVADDDVF